MREYELTFIVQPEISDEGCEGIQQKLDASLAQQGATRLFYDDWGKRRLAYEIQNFQKGHYFVLSFLDEGKAIPELERTLRLEDSVLRFLTVLADEQVKDIEARKAWAAEEERLQTERRVERVAREAEEAKAREEAEQARREAAAAAAAEAPAAPESEPSAPEGDETEAASSEEPEEAAPETEEQA
ncbi:MAG: 30S ribosomal protein S6 [Myxococcota bacterium]